jgi:hypothetical protein
MTRRRQSCSRKLRFEYLENRQLLSTSYTWTGNGGDLRSQKKDNRPPATVIP